MLIGDVKRGETNIMNKSKVKAKLNLSNFKKHQELKNWNDSETAIQMGVSPSRICRVKQGDNPGEEFIVGALKAFPEASFDELFIIPGVMRERKTLKKSEHKL